MTTIVLAFVGALLLVAGPTMTIRGLLGRRSIRRELANQKISFPGDGLPAGLAGYASTPVRTGEDARAFADLIARNVSQATDGRTYADIADEWTAGGRTDERLARMKETAFIGQALRGGLLSAYQAWQVTLLVIGLGALYTATGTAFLALALNPS